MSKKRTVIELEPEGRIHKETFMTTPMVCPYCNGRGFFMDHSFLVWMLKRIAPTVRARARLWQW